MYKIMHEHLRKTKSQKIQGEINRNIVIVDTNITLSKRLNRQICEDLKHLSNIRSTDYELNPILKNIISFLTYRTLTEIIYAAKSLQSCPTLCDPIDGSLPGSLSLGFSRQEHWSGCHFLLQCRKVKSENEVAQSCPTLSDPMDSSPPGSSTY